MMIVGAAASASAGFVSGILDEGPHDAPWRLLQAAGAI
jgi:hypothetical protein